MRSDGSDGLLWVLVAVGVGMMALALVLGRHPEVFARRNFPFNLGHDESTPRGWIVAVAIGGFGLALAVLGVTALLT